MYETVAQTVLYPVRMGEMATEMVEGIRRLLDALAAQASAEATFRATQADTRAAIRHLLDIGATVNQVSTYSGLSRQRISQIKRGIDEIPPNNVDDTP